MQENRLPGLRGGRVGEPGREKPENRHARVHSPRSQTTTRGRPGKEAGTGAWWRGKKGGMKDNWNSVN